MKKMVFLQISVVLYLSLALFLAIMAACVYVIINFFTKMMNNATALEWGYLIAATGGFIFMTYTFVRMARNRIVLNETEVYVPENWGNKDNKIQYETHIAYTDIRNIFLIISDRNSLNKKARWIITPMPYIIFECADNKQQAINVYYYSKKQIIKIIDNILLRTKNAGNELSIETGMQLLKNLKTKS